MAVTKIRKISSWTLIVCIVISVSVFVIFLTGGSYEPYKGEFWNPKYMELLLFWQYILFGITTVTALLLGALKFVSSFRANPKGGLMGLGVLVLFFAMLFITFALGSGEKLPITNEDVQIYNIPFWLKLSDMWLFSTYILFILIILAIIGGGVSKILNK